MDELRRHEPDKLSSIPNKSAFNYTEKRVRYVKRKSSVNSKSYKSSRLCIDNIVIIQFFILIFTIYNNSIMYI